MWWTECCRSIRVTQLFLIYNTHVNIVASQWWVCDQIAYVLPSCSPLDHFWSRGHSLACHFSPLLFSVLSMGRQIDYSIIGEEFGHLLVLGLAEYRNPKASRKNTYWYCECSLCGNVTTIVRDNLVSGNTSSCGCRRGLQRKIARKAGVSETAVSRILNNKLFTEGGVLRNHSESTVQKVRAVAKELGYYDKR